MSSLTATTLSAFVGPTTFVAEVRKRPCLYDLRAGHNNPELKKHAWEDVGAVIFDGWEKFSPKKKEATVREMQVKWRSMRDGFARALRKEEQDEVNGVPTYKRKRYIYYNELEFLLPYIVRRSTSSVLNDNESSSIEDVKVPVEIEIENHSPSDSLDAPSVKPIQFVTVTPPDVEETNVGNEIEESTSLHTTTVKILSELVTLQKEEKDDPMGNKKFLLSLLPFMKKLPDDVNLEVRLQLMSVLQTYTTRNSANV